MSVPDRRPDALEPDLRAETRALRNSRLATTLLLAALVNGATFGSFTYLSPVATQVAGIGTRWVPGLLALFGAGSFVGVTVAGRRPAPIVLLGGTALLAGWVALTATAGNAAVTPVLVLVQGALSFAVGSTLISQALYAVGGAPALATAALNVGAVLGPWLGGLPISAGLGYRAPLIVSALLVALALVTAVAGRGLLGGDPRVDFIWH